MSDFLAEARVVIRPDTTRFRAQLQEEVRRAVSQAQIPAVQIPLAIGAAGAGISAATAATASLVAAQEAAATSTLGLQRVGELENSTFGRQAFIMKAASDATLQMAGAQNTLAASSLRASNTGRQVGTAAGAAGAGLLGLRGAVLTASAGFLGATVAFQSFIKSVQGAAQLETQLNVFRVTVGATADEMSRAAENARALGTDLQLPGVTAIDAAQAQLQLARAGLSVQESIDGSRGALQLATAAQIDFAKAADLVAGNLNAFGLAGSDAVRVADLLTGAANESQGSIEDMGIGLRQVAGAASLLGLTVEDTVALLTQLTQAGLAGSDAGTTLRVALVRLARPDVRQEVERLVGSLEDLDGNLNPEKIVQLGEEISKSGGKLDQTNRLYELFGENALRVIGLLGQKGVAGFQANTAAVTEAGLAAEVAGARMEGLEGDIENLQNQASEAGITLGQLASPFISAVATSAGLALSGVNALAAGMRNLVNPPREAATSLSGLRTQLQEAQGDLDSFHNSALENGAVRDLRARVDETTISLNEMAAAAARAGHDLDGFGIVAGGVSTVIEGLVTALNEAADDFNANQGRPDTGLNVKGILNRVTGLDADEVRARIGGDTAELVSVLAEQQAFLQSQIDRQFVKNRPALRRSLEQALLGVTNDIASIQKQGAAATKTAASDAARAQQDADQQLLATLANRRDDVERAGAQAEAEGNLQRAIKFEDRLQALIKIQIAKVRAQVDDEKDRAAAIRTLRLALISSRNEEDALRQERAQAAAAQRQEGINLDIDFAETIGNVDREVAARQRLIALLRKQQAAVKKGSNEWKRLRNEIAEQQEAIKEARDQGEDAGEEGRSAQQVLFEALQKQQGFAANLLGNLIPTNATAGLVGGSTADTASIPDVGAGIRGEAAAKAGAAQFGPTSGQMNSEIDILRQILFELKQANNEASHPEAKYERKAGSAVMDTQ